MSLARPMAARPATRRRFTLLQVLGSDLLHWWEPSAETTTLNGSNVSQLNDRIGGAHAVQATAVNQPSYVADGGPGGRPCLTFQDAARWVLATVNLSAGHRTGMYVVAAHPAAGLAVTCSLRLAGTNQMSPFAQVGQGFHQRINFTGGAQDLNITAPARNTNWNLFAMRPLASGALSQIGTTTTTPNFSGVDTVGAVDQFYAGHTVSAGGSFAFCALVTNPTSEKDAYVREYINRVFGV
jgi:hypothetical protein